jgi:hypothetical protein
MLDINELRINFDQLKLLIPKAPYIAKKADDAVDPVTNEEKELIAKLKEYLEQKCFVWDTTGAEGFFFPLPSTVFREQNKIEFKTYEEAEVDYFETYETRSLTKDQLDEIWSKGQFTLKSKIPNLPYVWTLSEWLFKGTEKRNTSWCYDMYLVFYYFYYLKNRFREDKRHPWFSITYALIFLTKGIKDMYSLIFGRPVYSYTYINNIRNPSNLREVLLGRYYENLLRDNPDIVASVYLPKTRAIINEIHSNFMTKWKDFRIYKEHELRGLDCSPSEMKEKVADYRIELLVKEYESSEKLDERKKMYIIEILIANRIFDKIQNDYDKQFNTEKDSLREKLRGENPIRSYSKRWLELLTIEKFKPNIERLEQIRTERIDKELSDYPRAKKMIKAFIVFEKYYDENLKLLAERNTREPNYVAQIKFKHYPPYESKAHVDYNNITSYYLDTSTIKKVDTLNHFWRIKVMFLRLLADYHNIIRWGWKNCWNSSFGLKAFCAAHIVTRYVCDYNTGVVKEYMTSFTYRSALTYLYTWIKESRDQFESAGDFGFFGKRVGRVVNYIENYFLKLILWGFLVTFIYPIVILLMTILCFFLTIFLLIFWTFFRPFLHLIFHVFIFDMEGMDTSTADCPCLPFFWILTKRFIFQFLINLILSICLIFIQIFIGLFMLIFGNLRWMIRGLYDCCTFVIIRCNGNIPKINTSVAWRTAGPGISRSLFYRIEIDDALLLVRAEMEKQQLEEYKSKLNKIIEEPRTIHNGISKTIFKSCNAYLQNHQEIENGCNKYSEIIFTQINKRYQVYPTINNQIRFLKSNLDILLDASLDLIKDFAEKHDLRTIWDNFELVPGTYDQLTIKILKRVFHSENILTNIDETAPIMENQCIQHDEVKKLNKELNLDLFINNSRQKHMAGNSAFKSSSISGGDEDEEYLEKPVSSFGDLSAGVVFLRDGKHLEINIEHLDAKMKKDLEDEDK